MTRVLTICRQRPCAAYLGAATAFRRGKGETDARRRASILIGEQPARLVIGLRLRPVIALRRRRIAAVGVILLLLAVDLGVVDAAAGRSRVARLVRTAVGRIDIAVVLANLRQDAL